jgi:tetratricopeptide (TPR) repeat protein
VRDALPIARLRVLSARFIGALLRPLAPLLEPLPRFVLLRGRLWVEAGHHERALLYLHAHLAARPHDPWLHYQAGLAAQGKGLPREARARFAHAAALAPTEPTFRFALGHLLKSEGQLSGAAHELSEALRARPGDTRVLYALGTVERTRGRAADARDCFAAVVARRPRDVRALYALGVAAYEAGDLDGADATLRRALTLDGKHHKALYQRALVALDRGDAAGAAPLLMRALRLQPTYGPAHYALGRALADLEPSRARRHFQEAVLGHPPLPRAHLDLARLAEAAGQMDRAMAEYELYLRHFPEKRAGSVGLRLARLTAQRAAA